ncbi:MAG: DUF420 domain-containing protein [Deltaproteobacteria bacterium]|nr:DUF420 domain-containing protein [Deltaproteobacteria bacterium]
MGLDQTGYYLASLNAFLNGSSAVLLFTGWMAVRKKNVSLHRKCMVTAFLISILFLVSYLTRFYLTGTHRFAGSGLLRTVYLTILLTHTTLAATVPFLAVRTLFLALKGRLETHKKWARVTFPIWIYVSVTGVVVYLMLYWRK